MIYRWGIFLVVFCAACRTLPPSPAAIRPDGSPDFDAGVDLGPGFDLLPWTVDQFDAGADGDTDTDTDSDSSTLNEPTEIDYCDLYPEHWQCTDAGEPDQDASTDNPDGGGPPNQEGP